MSEIKVGDPIQGHIPEGEIAKKWDNYKAGIGGGIGALSGNMKDKSLLNEAQSLRDLAGDVTRYNPESAKNTLMGATQSLYNQTLNARETNDLDNARVNTNNINKIQGQVNPVASEAKRILDGYNK